MKCLHCNNTIDNDATFCPHCGQDLSIYARCPSCNELVENDAAFCPICGCKISDADAANLDLEIATEVAAEMEQENGYKPIPGYIPQEQVPQEKSASGSKKGVLGLLVIAALAAIGYWLYSSGFFNNGSKVEHIPFQTMSGNKWGLIGTDGKVLFSDEFVKTPTVAMHGRFWVKNNDDVYELFTAEKRPRQIGMQYDQAGAFIEDVAPVVAHNQAITFIDVDGNIKFVLDKADGKTVSECTNFSDGVAVFKAGDKYGCINAKGNIIVKPTYDYIAPANDGKMFAYNNTTVSINPDWTILTTTGHKIKTFKESKFDDIYPIFYSGLAVAKKKMPNDSVRAGIIDENANWVVQPNANFHEILQIYGDYFIFSDGSHCGLGNRQGEIVIRPNKYRQLRLAEKGKLLFAKEDGTDSRWRLMTVDETIVSNDSFYSVGVFIKDYAPVQVSKNEIGLIDADGNLQVLETTIGEIHFNVGDEKFFSQQVPAEAENGTAEEEADVTTEGDSTIIEDSDGIEIIEDEVDGRYIIEGSIANQAIHGEISIDRTKGTVNGSYRYLAMSNSAAQITFSGNISPDGELMVYEETEGHGVTGIFQARISSTKVTGTFINNNSGKQYAFTWLLTESEEADAETSSD